MINNKFLYVYYFALILVLALYTNMSQSPNLVIRMGYLAAMVLPLVNRESLFPTIIICAFGISKNTFAYPFMPTDMAYYILLALWFALLSLYHRDFTTRINPLFFLAIVFVALNDISTQGELSEMAIVFFICLLFFFCVEDDLDVATQLLPLSFIIISLTISYWVLFCPEAQINSYNTAGDMEQKGWSDPNYLSATLGIGFVIAVRELLKGGNKILYTTLLSITVLGSTIALLILASRGAILSATLAVTALFIFSKTSNRTKIIAVVVATLFIVFLYTNQYIDFVMARIEAEDGTGSHRTEVWLSKINDFFLIDNPLYWIFGVGQSEGAKLGSYLGSTVTILSTHNDFLSILIYYGFIGMLFSFSIIIYPLRICMKEDRPQIIIFLTYLMMCSMTIEPLAHGNFVYWGFLFYIFIFAQQSQEQELIDEEVEEFEEEFDTYEQE